MGDVTRVELKVDGKLPGRWIMTETLDNGDIIKTISLEHAENLVANFNKKIEFYNSDYFKWGQRKTA